MKIVELKKNILFEKGIKDKKNRNYLKNIFNKLIKDNIISVTEKNIIINAYKDFNFFYAM